MNTEQLHQTLDVLIQRAVDKLPANRKPCCARCTTPHCCSEPAYCDDKEADLMIASLSTEQRAAAAERTKEWKAKAAPFLGIRQPHSFPYRMANIPCPLLDEAGRCSVYKHRPSDCRMFLALGKPEDCAMPARMTQKYAEYSPPEVFHKVQAVHAQFNPLLEYDHIGAHLVRKLLGEDSFTTAAHVRFELEAEPKTESDYHQ